MERKDLAQGRYKCINLKAIAVYPLPEMGKSVPICSSKWVGVTYRHGL